MNEFLVPLVTWGIPLLLAITLHEAAHAYAAKALGDRTAESQGRCSLNPLVHVDPLGTVVVPMVLFLSGAPFLIGWAKPVPVHLSLLRHPRRDMALVAIAGPAANAVIAAGFWLVLMLAPVSIETTAGALLVATCVQGILLNIVLALFNLLPIPPLDGSRIVAWLLPREMGNQFASLDVYALPIFIGVLFLLPLAGDIVGLDLNIIKPLVWDPAFRLTEVLTAGWSRA